MEDTQHKEYQKWTSDWREDVGLSEQEMMVLEIPLPGTSPKDLIKNTQNF